MTAEIGGAFRVEDDTLQRLYCQEIERVISELDSCRAWEHAAVANSTETELRECTTTVRTYTLSRTLSVFSGAIYVMRCAKHVPFYRGHAYGEGGSAKCRRDHDNAQDDR